MEYLFIVLMRSDSKPTTQVKAIIQLFIDVLKERWVQFLIMYLIKFSRYGDPSRCARAVLFFSFKQSHRR